MLYSQTLIKEGKALVKAYRAIQQWNHWLTQPLGARVLEAEKHFLPALLTDCYGKHALLIGVPHQSGLLKFSSIPDQVLLSPILSKNKNMRFIEGEFYELPIASASIDLVLLPHTLEMMDNPRQLLMEACRVVKPEGHIVIFGFNPYSLWGLKKRFTHHHDTPWSGNFIPANQVKKWISLADFELIKQDAFLFRAPLQHHPKIYDKFNIVEWLGSKLWKPFGGVYMLMAKAKVTPLTPIKLHWKQQLSGLHVSIPGPSTRNWI